MCYEPIILILKIIDDLIFVKPKMKLRKRQRGFLLEPNVLKKLDELIAPITNGATCVKIIFEGLWNFILFEQVTEDFKEILAAEVFWVASHFYLRTSGFNGNVRLLLHGERVEVREESLNYALTCSAGTVRPTL